MFTYDIVKLGNKHNSFLNNDCYNKGSAVFSLDIVKDKIIEKGLQEEFNTLKVNLDNDKVKELRKLLNTTSTILNLPFFNEYIIDNNKYYERSYAMFYNTLNKDNCIDLMYNLANIIRNKCDIKYMMIKNIDDDIIKINNRDEEIVKTFKQENFVADVGEYLNFIHNKFEFDDGVVYKNDLYVPNMPKTQWQAGVRSKELFLNLGE